MIAADWLLASVHGLVLSGVSSSCRCACSAHAFAWHFALHLVLHSSLPSSVFLRLHGRCCRTWRACAVARHTAQHPALHCLQPFHVQASCLEHGRPLAIAAFAWALAAGAAAPPGRDCRERMREANAEGKIEGRGTTARAKPVCTWVGGGTRHKVASCRQQPQGLAGIGNTVCRMRSGAMGLVGTAS